MATHHGVSMRPRRWRQRPLLLAIIVFSGSSFIQPSIAAHASESTLRLADGASAYQGRVELLHGGAWTSVCSDGFGADEARVVCRQIHLPTAGAAAFSIIKPGTGSEQTRSSDLAVVRCRGDEPSLRSCNVTTARCDLSKVAGVRCAAPHRPRHKHRSTPAGATSTTGKAAVVNRRLLDSTPAPPRGDPPATEPRLIPAPAQPSPPPPCPSPQPPAPAGPVTCSVTLIGLPGVNGTAHVACTAGPTDDIKVNVTVGGQLLKFSEAWTGVVVSQRPGDDDWGVTFNDVPYLRLRDSMVRDSRYGRGPLLQLANCPTVELVNFTLTNIRPPRDSISSSTKELRGLVHLTGVTNATLRGFNCSSCRTCHRWSCILLQYGSGNGSTKQTLDMSDCTFNWVQRGTNCTSNSTGQNAMPRSVVGNGVVVVTTDTTASSRTTVGGESSRGGAVELSVKMAAVQARNNEGGSGAFFSSLNLSQISIDVSSSIFENNKAWGDGGVFAAWGPVDTFTIREGTSFQTNAAVRNGGALWLSEGARQLTITSGSSLTANYVRRGAGGAIWSYGAVDAFELSGGSKLCENKAMFGGGAALGGLGTLMITGRSNASGNTADEDGGAFLIDNADPSSTSITLDDQSALTGNRAGQHGGAIRCRGGIAALELRGGSALSDNAAPASGGAVSVFPGGVGTITVQDGSVISDNTARRVSPSSNVDEPDASITVLATATNPGCCPGAKDGPAGGGNGSADAAVPYNGVDDSPDEAPNGSGGALAVYGNVGVLELSSGSALSGNRATQDGGAIWVGGAVGTVRLTGASQVHGNTASGSGGALYVAGGAGEFVLGSGSAASDNAAGLHGGFALLGGNGTESIVLEEGSLVANNSASRGNGGGICVMAAVATTLTMAISGARLTSNLAGRLGGALYLGPSESTSRPSPPPLSNRVDGESNALPWKVQIWASDLSDNTAGAAGGAVSVSAPPYAAVRVSVENSTLRGNLVGGAPGGDGGTARGGGALALSGVVDSGGVWQPTPVAGGDDNCIAADQGDTVTRGSGGSCTAEIRGTEFAGCSAGGNDSRGGALLLTHCTALLDRSAFVDNTAARSGGAVASEAQWFFPAGLESSNLGSRLSLAVLSSSFDSNVAQGGYGGAIAVACTVGGVQVCGSSFTGNNALESGGAVASLPASLPALGGEGGSVDGTGKPGVTANGSSLQVVASSFQFNQAGALGGGIFAAALADLLVTGSNFTSNTALISGGGIAVALPLFAFGNASGLVAPPGSGNLTSTSLIANHAGCNASSPLTDVQTVATLTNISFRSNAAGVEGEALAVIAQPGDAGDSSVRQQCCNFERDDSGFEGASEVLVSSGECTVGVVGAGARRPSRRALV